MDLSVKRTTTVNNLSAKKDMIEEKDSIDSIKQLDNAKILNTSLNSSNDCSFNNPDIKKSIDADVNELKEIQVITKLDDNNSETSYFPKTNQDSNCECVNTSICNLEKENETSDNTKEVTCEIRKKETESIITKNKTQKSFYTSAENVEPIDLSTRKIKKKMYGKVLNMEKSQYLNKSLHKPAHFSKKVVTENLDVKNISLNFTNSNSRTASEIILTNEIVIDKNRDSISISPTCIDVDTDDGAIQSSDLFQDIHISEDEELETKEDISNPIVPVLDLSEEPVEFKIPELHQTKTMTISKEKKKKFMSESLIKTGRWSKAEKETLERNYLDFTTRFGIHDARLLFGTRRKFSTRLSEFIQLQKFLKAKHFLLRLGKNLNNRTLGQIHAFSRLYFDPLKQKKLSSVDISSILHLQRKYGNQWQLISEKTGIRADQCQNHYFSKIQKTGGKGKWSDEEIKKLLDAIKEISKTSDLSDTDLKRISWEKVASIVGSRNRKQCCRMWHMHLAKQQNRAKYKEWDRSCNVNLVSQLNGKFKVNDETDINWVEMHKIFEDVSPSVYYLRSKFNKLKRGCKGKSMHYCDFIDILFKKYCSNIDC